MDSLYMRNMEFFAYHGVLSEERINGQNFEIDVELGLDLTAAALTDNVRDTIDYALVYQDVKEFATQRRYNLIETLASRIADTILAKYPKVHEICVHVRKPQAPIAGKLSGPEVRIRRVRND